MFHPDFREFPYWWEAFEPTARQETEPPRESRVVVIGAGYAGLAAARDLARNGMDVCVFDAEAPGYGASTRSGGMVGGAASVKTPPFGKPEPPQV